MSAAATKYLVQPTDKLTRVNDDGTLTVGLDALSRFGGGNPAMGRRELRSLLAAERSNAGQSGPTKWPQSVRLATPSDEKEILDLLMMDLAENAAHIAPIAEERVMAVIQAGTRQRGGLVGVIGKPIVAVVALTMEQWWWSNGWHWMETVNFVHPDHRKSGHVDALMDFCKAASDDMSKNCGYTWYLLCGVLGAWRVHAKIALYRRKFQQAGAAFCYPAPPIKGN